MEVADKYSKQGKNEGTTSSKQGIDEISNISLD
jgi:hypothetical protein